MIIPRLLEHGGPSQAAAVVAGDGPAVSYDQLRQQVDALAVKLSEFGIRRGDRVAIALPNGIEMLVSFLAASAAGTAAPLNPGFKLEEFRFYLADTRAKALIVPPGIPNVAREAASEQLLIIEAALDTNAEVQFHSAAPKVVGTHLKYPGADDIALVLHTSGTTSRPKRVPLSHSNVMASASTVARTYELSANDVSLCVMPLFHVHGLVASALATLNTGGTVVFVPRFNPLSFWSTVRDHHVTWYSAVPTIHQLLLSRLKEGARPPGAEQLRFVRSCSAALSPQTMDEMENKFCAPVVEAYGMTEAAHQMASNPLPPGVRQPGSVGVETGVEIAILNEKGDLLPREARGEVAIRGRSVFNGYEDNSEANAASFTNGWFRTGDEGFLDSGGYLSLVGRIKELINRGGEKIAPREIDEALASHPAVAEAVSFAVPDRVYGEEVAAAVVLRSAATEAELTKHCKQLLADFKIPKTIYILESIPRTATGKIQRRLVAAEVTRDDQ
jgi:acyl-CoA synthetase (AMP-forming)/AMP-acid ligase II